MTVYENKKWAQSNVRRNKLQPSPLFRRQFGTRFDFLTRNTEPMIAPSRSAIQQRSPDGSK
jgi:hypothetical protein